MKVVHLTPHMSGGLAAVLLSTLKYSVRYTPSVEHEIVTFDRVTPAVMELFGYVNNKLYVNRSNSFINRKIEASDVVHLEYWNHPLIYRFLYENRMPPARILACCHVSGLYRPQVITRSAVEMADIFLAVTRATDTHELFDAAANPSFRQKLRLFRFPVDVDRFDRRINRNPRHFTVGYVGTVAYAKMHRRFLAMSSRVKVPNLRYVVCGEDNVDNIEDESHRYGAGLFDFVGFQRDVGSIFNRLDVFAYPLKPTHFGSGEQVILEAMYHGLPVVAFANPAESEIIQDQVTGLLVDNEEAYVRAIEYLFNNPEARERIGHNARRYVEEQLHPGRCFGDLETIYREMMETPKCVKTMPHMHEETRLASANDPDIGAKLFIESLGSTGGEFLESFVGYGVNDSASAHGKIANTELAMKVRTKGSLYQYQYFFPNDLHLRRWVELIENHETAESGAGSSHRDRARPGSSP